MDAPILPSVLYVSFLSSLPALTQNLNAAIETRDYQRTIQFATSFIHHMSQSELLLALLDARAHAYSMQGQLNRAIGDSEQMIRYAPATAAGYLRKGGLLSMYGQQEQAVETYNQGLEAGQMSTPDVDHLVMAISTATMLKEKKVDFLTIFPFEVTSEIFAPLPQSSRIECLKVSKTWRERVLSFSNAWSHFSVDDNQEQLIEFVPTIGAHVEFLTINTYLESTRSIYIKSLKKGQFKRLKSLKMTDMSTLNLLSYIGALSIGFWQTRSTLRILDLDLGSSELTVSLAEVLLSCSSITDVTYTTKASMMDLCGDFSLLDDGHPLENLHLTSSCISADDMDMVLQQCKRLRRLVMNGCDPTVFTPITTHGTNLEILGYNPSFSIPKLEGSPLPGLQMIYTNNGGASLAASVFMPLIYKHRKTLRTFYVSTAALSDSQLQQMFSTYPDFILENITKMTFWCHSGIQQFLLPSILDSVTLEKLEAICVHDLSAVTRVLMALPPLTMFELSHTSGLPGNSDRTNMVELFERYARLSASRPTVLNSITLRFCDEITDETLMALAGVKTVQEITLGGLHRVSTEAIEILFDCLATQLTSVKLTEMDAVTDTVMYDLGSSEKLTTVYLNGVPKVTMDGLRALCDPFLTRSHKLETLTVKRCLINMTDEDIRYFERNVKTFET